MSTMFILHVLTSDHFISCTVCISVNTAAVMFMYRIIFYNFYIGLDCFSRTKHNIKIGKTWQMPKSVGGLIFWYLYHWIDIGLPCQTSIGSGIATYDRTTIYWFMSSNCMSDWLLLYVNLLVIVIQTDV